MNKLKVGLSIGAVIVFSAFNYAKSSSAPITAGSAATDILPLERIGVFRGRYHALGGKLSPLDGIGPEQLRIAELVERVGAERPSEVILALGAELDCRRQPREFSEGRALWAQASSNPWK